MIFFGKHYNEVESRIVDTLNGCNKLLDAGWINHEEVNWRLYHTNVKISSRVLDKYKEDSGKHSAVFMNKLFKLKEKEQQILGYHLIES